MSSLGDSSAVAINFDMIWQKVAVFWRAREKTVVNYHDCSCNGRDASPVSGVLSINQSAF